MKPPQKPRREPRAPRSAPTAAPARAGKSPGGRPRSSLPPEIIEKLGPPPSSPLLIISWGARVVAEAAYLEMQGKLGRELAGGIRAMASALARLAPLDTIARLEQKLREDRDEIEADNRGPAKEERADGVKPAAIRRDPG